MGRTVTPGKDKSTMIWDKPFCRSCASPRGAHQRDHVLAVLRVGGPYLLAIQRPAAGGLGRPCFHAGQVRANTPFTVTNSNPLQQLTNETNWYAMARLSFNFTTTIVGVQQNAANSVNSSILYPNPAYNNATLAIGLKDASSITINVYDVVGQLVKTTKADGQLGENNINIDLNNLTTGIYMVNVKVGNTTSTKKLIIQ